MRAYVRACVYVCVCLTSVPVLRLDFAVVVVQRLQVLVAVSGGPGQPHVGGAEQTHVPVPHTQSELEQYSLSSSFNTQRLMYSAKLTRGSKTTHQNDSLEVLVLDELHDDVLLRLDLQHLQGEAEERRGLDIASKHSAHILELHGLVHHQLGCGETQQEVTKLISLLASS